MHNQEGDSRILVIQRHFRFFTKDLNISFDDLIVLAEDCGALNQTDCYKIESSHPTLKMNTFWKQLLRKGERYCERMIGRLNNRNTNTLEPILNDQVAIPVPDTEISKERLEQLQTHIYDEMDLSRGIVDMLFQCSTITLDDHDEIDRTTDRRAKREKLMEILLSKNDSHWIPYFIHILKETDHDTLIDNLTHVHNGPTGTITDLNRQHVRPRTFEIGVESPEYDTEQFRGIQRDRPSIESVIHQMIDGEVLDLREGSVVITVRTSNPDQFISVLNGSDEKKRFDFLNRLFGSSIHLVKYFGNESKVKLWAEEVEFSTQDVTLQNDICAGCYHTTVNDNYKVIFDEIEDDIMNETMDTVRNETCKEERIERIMQTRSRTSKADEFLEFILENTDALLQFKTVFEKRSQLTIKQSKCRKCSTEPDSTEKICELEVKLTTDNTGKVIVTSLPKEPEYVQVFKSDGQKVRISSISQKAHSSHIRKQSMKKTNSLTRLHSSPDGSTACLNEPSC